MKFVTTVLFVLTLSTACYAEVTPLEVMEEAAHTLAQLGKDNQIDASYLTDTWGLMLRANADSTGFVAQVQAFPGTPKRSNILELLFDSTGAFTGKFQDYFRGVSTRLVEIVG